MQQAVGQNQQHRKINKIKYFIERNDQERPVLPSDVGIRQLLREYLNDDDFNIFWRNELVFGNDEYEHILQKLYDEWTNSQQGNKNLDDFILFWVKNEHELQIEYSLYDQIGTEHQKNYPNKIFIDLEKQENKSPIKHIKAVNQYQSNKIADLSPICSIHRLDRESIDPCEFLNKYFIHFAKKQVTTVSKATFNQYEHYYSSLSLSKWMLYTRDIGLIKHSKKLTAKKMKQIFSKFENKQKVLTFDLFKKAIDQIMKRLFGEDQQKIKNQGYILLGIKNQRNYQEKFRSMGMLAPIYNPKLTNINTRNSQAETLTSNVSLMKKIVNRLKPQKSINSQFSNQTFQTIQNSRLSQSGNHLPNLRALRNTDSSKMSNKQTTSRLLTEQDLNPIDLYSLQQSSMLRQKQRKHKYDETLLQDIIKDQEDDPYLKRYNSKQNIRYHCVANRIDQRIQKITTKY